MRIISGKFKSRNIFMVESDTTRPTTDKVRGSIFNIIGPYFDGGVVLDLFAGSGALGIECISRGVEFCIFNDINKEPLNVIKKNIDLLKINNQSLITKLDYKSALKEYSKKYKFDYIFLDPPYKMDIINSIIEDIIKYDLLNDGGLIICELSKDNIMNEFDNLEKIKEVIYGIRKVCIYEK